MKPRSCDTFVVLPPNTENGCVVFGKNSDRPSDEVQEVIYVAAADHPSDSKVKCTYIQIDQVPHTYSVILSKPSWMWGAEMGANEHGVCIGNEAVWTKLNSAEDAVEKLLGMDLLRLGLERATTAEEAVHIVTFLLEAHGQGGNCSNTEEDFTYHNSFLIADPTEAWVLDTTGRHWAAEKIVEGYRNISNDVSIGTNITLMSSDLHSYAKEKKMWNPSDVFSFKAVYGYNDENERCIGGRNLLKRLSSKGKFKEVDMFKVLRDKESGICISSGHFLTTGSQVSTLYKADSGKPCCHWFTGTPNPEVSMFKPFFFTESIDYPLEIVSPGANEFEHALYKDQVKIFKLRDTKLKQSVKKMKLDFEDELVRRVDLVTEDFEKNKNSAHTIFKCSVNQEIAFLTHEDPTTAPRIEHF